MALLESHERIGSIIEGRYEIVRILGEGGMGVVFEGRELQLDRRVAIKLLHPHLAANPELRARFLREARAAATLEHENVVRIYAVGAMPDGASYLVMEFLDGESFASLLDRRSTIGPHELHELLAPAMDAIAHAHALGIVHRDIKPDNIFLAKGPRGIKTKVVDFGIAKVAGTGAMTATNSMLGTPLYMSPEQIQGSKDVTAAADVWSMGVVVYQALTGTVPFDVVDQDNPLALLAKVMIEAPVPIEQRLPTIAPAYAAVVNRALAKEIGVRFATMGDFLDAISVATRDLAEGRDFGAWGGGAYARTLATPPGALPSISPLGGPAPGPSVHSERGGGVSPTPDPRSSEPVLPKSRPSRVLPLLAAVGVVGLAAIGYVALADPTSETPENVAASATTGAPPTVVEDHPAPAAAASPTAASIDAGTVPTPDDVTPSATPGEPAPAQLPLRRSSGTTTRPQPRTDSSNTSVATMEAAVTPRTEPPPSPATCYREVGNGVRIRVPCP